MSSSQFITMCVTDLDGTLLNSEHTISPPNLQTLTQLKEKGICRIAATGRSLYSLYKVLAIDAPFDYVIFSTGAGIMDWHSKEIVESRHISSELAEKALTVLKAEQVDFMYHAPIPENHRFVYFEGKGHPDFYRRIRLYQEFAEPYQADKGIAWQSGTQFLVVADKKDLSLYNKLQVLLSPLRLVRTTSPLDHMSLWLEIFSPEVSKGTAVAYIAKQLGINLNDIVVVGNDYNDCDMLDLTCNAYITDNAPSELKDNYKVVAGYNNHGFTEAIADWLNKTII